MKVHSLLHYRIFVPIYTFIIEATTLSINPRQQLSIIPIIPIIILDPNYYCLSQLLLLPLPL